MKEKLLSFLFFVVLSVVFLCRFFVFGKIPFPGDLLVSFYAPWSAEYNMTTIYQGGDVIRQLYPWKSLSIDTLKSGEFPLWNPYSFAGNPHLANIQSAIFYPFNFIFFITSKIASWVILTFLQPILSGFFLYLFLRIRKVSKLGSILGSISFSYSLFLMVWLEWNTVGHAFLYLPLAFYAIEILYSRKKFIALLLLVSSFVFSIMAGHTQMSLYVLALSTMYMIFRYVEDKKKEVKNLFIYAFALVLSLGIAAIQTFPTIEFYGLAARSSTSASYIFDRSLLPIKHLITVVIPDYFGNPTRGNFTGFGTYIEEVSYFGLIPLFFAIFAIIRRKEKVVRFFGFIILFTIILALRNPFSLWFYSLPIPVINSSGPTRILSLVGLFGGALAGFGFDAFRTDYLKGKYKQSFFILCGFVTIFAILLFLANFGKNTVALRNSVIPLFSLSVLFITVIALRLKKLPKEIFHFLLIATLVFDLFYYGWKINPFVSPKLVFPDHPVFSELKKIAGVNRFFGVEDGYIDTNFATYYKLFSTEGYDPLNIRRYGELVSSSYGGKLNLDIPRSDVNMVKVDDVGKFSEQPYRKKLFQLLGIKYIVDKNDQMKERWFPETNKFNPELFTLLWQEGKWKIYQYNEALPRAFLVNDYVVESDPSKIISKLYDPLFLPSKSVILEEVLPKDVILNGDTVLSFVTLSKYSGNKVFFNVKSVGTNLLFLSDNYFPGWEAYVDNKKTPIYRADYTFRAVAVPNGDHVVTFIYNPSSFKLGSKVTIVSIVLLFGLIFTYFKVRKVGEFFNL